MDPRYNIIGSGVTTKKKNKKPLIIGIIIGLVFFIAGIVIITLKNNMREEEDQKAVSCVTEYYDSLHDISSFFKDLMNGKVRIDDILHYSTVSLMDSTNKIIVEFKDKLNTINTNVTSREISNAIQQIKNKIDTDYDDFEKMYDEYQQFLELSSQGYSQQINIRYDMPEDFYDLQDTTLPTKIFDCNRILFQYDEIELIYGWNFE